MRFYDRYRHVCGSCIGEEEYASVRGYKGARWLYGREGARVFERKRNEVMSDLAAGWEAGGQAHQWQAGGGSKKKLKAGHVQLQRNLQRIGEKQWAPFIGKRHEEEQAQKMRGKRKMTTRKEDDDGGEKRGAARVFGAAGKEDESKWRVITGIQGDPKKIAEKLLKKKKWSAQFPKGMETKFWRPGGRENWGRIWEPHEYKCEDCRIHWKGMFMEVKDWVRAHAQRP